jgi:hypothetical protein
MAFLTDRTLAPSVSLTDLVHVVITGDTSQNPAGSSYKAQLGQITSLITPLSITGGTYNPTNGVVTFTNSSGGTFDVSGFTTGFTAVEVTGFTYNDSNTFSILETDATILTASINVVTGMTFNGFLRTSGSTTSGLYSFAFGSNLTSSGDYSFSQGLNNTSSGNYSHVEGRGSTSSGSYSHAEGKGTDSSGSDSHAEGANTISSGVSSHAEGDGTESFGANSHSEGQNTLANAKGSHAEGSGTTTYGEYSHSEGLGTITNGQFQHVQGQFNLTASTQSAFIIGNGVTNSSRSNLVLAAGNTFNLYGDLNVSGTIYSTGSTQFMSTTGITTSAVTLSSGITYNGISFSGNVDLNIPSPSSLTGLKLIIKDEGGYAGSYRIRVTPVSGTIDGNSYIDMNINYMSLSFVARNNNWWII